MKVFNPSHLKETKKLSNQDNLSTKVKAKIKHTAGHKHSSTLQVIELVRQLTNQKN
jgi:hypothetical protein